jgi:chromosome partitioning protein
MANLPYIVVNFRASKCKYIQNFDTQAHASMGVGCSGSYDNGVHSIFFGGMLSTTFIPTVFESLTLAPASEFFDVYENGDLRGILSNRFWNERIHEFFDYVVIDTPPTFDSLLKNAQYPQY